MKHPYWQIAMEDGSTQLAHRLVYSWEKGKIPKGFHVHHKCENKQCLNTDHMEVMSVKKHHQLHKKHKFNTKISMPIAQIHPEHGLLKVWPSMREAERNGFDHQNISKVCNGKYDIAYGCWWMRL